MKDCQPKVQKSQIKFYSKNRNVLANILGKKIKSYETRISQNNLRKVFVEAFELNVAARPETESSKLAVGTV